MIFLSPRPLFSLSLVPCLSCSLLYSLWPIVDLTLKMYSMNILEFTQTHCIIYNICQLFEILLSGTHFATVNSTGSRALYFSYTCEYMSLLKEK